MKRPSTHHSAERVYNQPRWRRYVSPSAKGQISQFPERLKVPLRSNMKEHVFQRNHVKVYVWIYICTCSGLVFTQFWPCKYHQPVVVVLTNEWAAYTDGLASAQQGGATGGLPLPQSTKTLMPFIWTPLRAAEKQEWSMLALAICQDHLQLWAASQKDCVYEDVL